MTPRDFCYWLQGHLEIGEVNELDAAQIAMIKKHLALVFINVTGTTAPQTSVGRLTDQLRAGMEILTC